MTSQIQNLVVATGKASIPKAGEEREEVLFHLRFWRYSEGNIFCSVALSKKPDPDFRGPHSSDELNHTGNFWGERRYGQDLLARLLSLIPHVQLCPWLIQWKLNEEPEREKYEDLARLIVRTFFVGSYQHCTSHSDSVEFVEFHLDLDPPPPIDFTFTGAPWY